MTASGHGGNGLAGLGERAEALRGTTEAGGIAGGGFRLAVSVPVTGRPSPGAHVTKASSE